MTTTHTPEAHLDAAVTCPVCEARAVSANLHELATDLSAAGGHTNPQDTATRVRNAAYSLDYVLALVDANNLDAGIAP